ncbi:MAG: hypothetical protein HY292_01345 [Planctomycetes bacterium]|nr:hypothetical protein [Planctomycetota bacterium]
MIHTGPGEQSRWELREESAVEPGESARREDWVEWLRRAVRSLPLRRDFKEQVLRRLDAGEWDRASASEESARSIERDRGDPRKGDLG